MKPNLNALFRFQSPIKRLGIFLSSQSKFQFFSTIDGTATTSDNTSDAAPIDSHSADVSTRKDVSDVFRHWGCTDSDIHRILTRRPSLRNSDLDILQSKLRFLRELGISPSNLVNIINRRPRFLGYCVNRYFDHRLEYLESFFGSRKLLVEGIVSNPSLLTYDFQKTVVPIVDMYAKLGISKSDFLSLLSSRPTLIPRSKLCEEKLEYISRTGTSKESRMYKYVVAIIAISRVDTLREKLAHFQKFGISEDQILGAIGRSPYLLTLSTDKVQRNMTFVVGIMKLSAKVVLDHPFLLYFNLETTLKPRMHLACKIDELGLVPRIKGPALLTALRMADKRFIKAFITCHPPDVSEDLLESYTNAKDVKRLAVSSKRNLIKGFPV